MTSDTHPIQPCLHQALTNLQLEHNPHVPNPPDFNKRASVALILRIRPSYAHAISTAEEWRKGQQSPVQSLAAFFDLQWVQSGEPEALFIRRTGRVGDRWSGHTALPGGKRDPVDQDDKATAIRETMEEVGLDLTAGNSVFVGNLPERVITTAWGKKGLMVLCPFVFLLTSPQSPALVLQPSEVASAHWVPIQTLLMPSLRTHEYVDVCSRLSRKSTAFTRILLRSLLGKMVFPAIRLIPSESVFASASSDFADSSDSRHMIPSKRIAPNLTSNSSPILLWGITLGIAADLIDKLPPYSAVDLWNYPTFTPLDLKLLVYILTYSVRRDNSRIPKTGPICAGRPAAAVSEAEPQVMDPDGVQNARLNSEGRSPKMLRSMLGQYFDRVTIAIAAFLLMRGTAATGLGYLMVRLWRKWKT